jgi:thiol-disulfide isomerase/thioredoxin
MRISNRPMRNVASGALAAWLGFGAGATTCANAAEPVLSPQLHALLGAAHWLNGPPLQPASVSGKVVLVNFWTFSCINCLRVLPHVREWAAKYKDRGLVVVGVQTPEFAFEKNLGNIRNAIAGLEVRYPVAVDNDFRIWNAFDNDAWPALYFIGPNGKIRDRVLGEGDYEGSEREIQQLLSEAAGTHVTGSIVDVNANGPEAAADTRDLQSPETYVGYSQSMRFASPGVVREDAPKLYSPVARLSLNRWTLTGVWTIDSEFAALTAATGRIAYRFHARDLHMVLGNSLQDHPIRFRITIDGAPPGVNHGSDVDAHGWGVLNEDRLYQLVRQVGPVVDRTFEIEFLDSGVRAYAFTFG